MSVCIWRGFAYVAVVISASLEKHHCKLTEVEVDERFRFVCHSAAKQKRRVRQGTGSPS